MKSLIRSWLGVDFDDSPAEQRGALGELLDALDRLEPSRARHLARFAYLLGRVAHADQHVSPEETRTMEQLIATEGELETEQAMLVVALAKSSNLLFGGTDDFLVARDFAAETTHAQKRALLRCLFAVSAIESDISISEEREIQRVARELRVEQPEVVALRLEYRRHLPGLTNPARE